MKICCLLHTHDQYETVIEEWASEERHLITYHRSFLNSALPNRFDFDLLVVMGGPQSLLELTRYPYLQQEIDFIHNAFKKNKKIIGICLGAQLISEALGARSEKSPQYEIGMHPITLNHLGRQDKKLSEFPSHLEVMQWHYDMPGLPKEASILAHSTNCPRQIVKYNDLTYGFQCHLELNQSSSLTILNKSENLSPQVQARTRSRIMDYDFKPANQYLKSFLNKF